MVLINYTFLPHISLSKDLKSLSRLQRCLVDPFRSRWHLWARKL